MAIPEATFEKAEIAGEVSIDPDTRRFIQDSAEHYISAFRKGFPYRKVKKTLKQWLSANDRKAEKIINSLLIDSSADPLARVCGRAAAIERSYAHGNYYQWLNGQCGIEIWRKDIDDTLKRLELRFGGGRERHLTGDFIKDLALAYIYCGGKGGAHYSSKNEKMEGKFVSFCEALCGALPKPLMAGVSVGDQARRKLREVRPKGRFAKH